MKLFLILAAVAMGLGEFSSQARNELESRIRATLEGGRRNCSVEGAVTGLADGAFFLQCDDDALKIACGSTLPKPGDVVEVNGSPALEGGRVLLSAKSWKRVGKAELPVPRKVSADDLSSDEPGGSGVNWMRVAVSGRAIDRTPSGFAIDAGGLPITVIASKMPPFLEDCGRTRPYVRVVGVVEQILDQSVLFGRAPYVLGVKLQLNSPEDIVLEPDVVYLANVRDRRMMLAIVAAFVLLGIGLVVTATVVLRQRRRHFRTETLMAERKRMADDIHDTIEQHLVGAGMLLQLNRNKEARDVLLRAKSELRDIVWGLKNDDMMRLTPTQMLHETAEKETKKGIFRVTARLTGLPDALSAQEMRDLSLVVREAIGNAVKHGGAKKIAITSDPLPDGGWMLRVANDGKPFDEASAPGVADGHFGLEGMRERARRLGATVSFAVRNGWTVLSLERPAGGTKGR